MKTKILISLLLVCAAGARAASYTSDWAAFDSGFAQTQSGVVTHSGVLGAWATPFMPVAVPVPAAPILTITLIGTDVRVAWPAATIGFELEERTDLNGGTWIAVPGPYQSDAVEQFILTPVTPGSRFYRLRSL